jgi:hypothetical protein
MKQPLERKKLLGGIAGGFAMVCLSFWIARVGVPVTEVFWPASGLYVINLGRLLLNFGFLCLIEFFVITIVFRVGGPFYTSGNIPFVFGATALSIAAYVLVLGGHPTWLPGVTRFRLSSLLLELLFTTAVGSSCWLLFVRPLSSHRYSLLVAFTFLLAFAGGLSSNRGVYRGALEGSGLVRPATIKHLAGAFEPPTRFLAYAPLAPIGGIPFLLHSSSLSPN